MRIPGLIVLFLILGSAVDGGRVTLSEDEKAYFVKLHNEARKVDGVEEEVTWDNKLAEAAAELVNKCKFKHSGGPYGENLAASGPKDTNYIAVAEIAVGLWVAEKQNYEKEGSWRCMTKHASDETCGHYTQVVWKKSRKIGCAIAHCASLPNFIACEYYPRGNYIGQTPF